MKPTIAVCSLFRDSAPEVAYFRALLDNQLAAVGHPFDLRFSFIEGDSRDDTWARLSRWADEDPRVLLGKIDVEPLASWEARIQAWAALGNATIDQLRGHAWDYLLWCESDLCLPPDLIQLLLRSQCDIVAPAIYLGGLFYDIWGFRALDGSHFRNEAPYHPQFHPLGLTELSSVGSVVLFRRAVFDAGIRFRGEYPDGLLAGVCADARAKGFRVFCDSRTAVVHPTARWERQQYRLAGVAIDCAAIRAAGDELRARVMAAVLDGPAPLLGGSELEADHPVLADIRRRIEALLPGDAFELRTTLRSQSERHYTLVISDRRSTRAA